MNTQGYLNSIGESAQSSENSLQISRDSESRARIGACVAVTVMDTRTEPV
jgi:hypothetical protein